MNEYGVKIAYNGGEEKRLFVKSTASHTWEVEAMRNWNGKGHSWQLWSKRTTVALMTEGKVYI